MILLDTDHLTVLSDQRHSSHDRLMNRLSTVQTSIPIVVAEEQLRGFLALIHRYRDVKQQLWAYERLFELLKALQVNEIVPFGAVAHEKYLELTKIKPRIGTEDLKIASIALTHDALLISNNLRDFKRVPGLKVESWIE